MFKTPRQQKSELKGIVRALNRRVSVPSSRSICKWLSFTCTNSAFGGEDRVFANFRERKEGYTPLGAVSYSMQFGGPFSDKFDPKFISSLLRRTKKKGELSFAVERGNSVYLLILKSATE